MIISTSRILIDKFEMLIVLSIIWWHYIMICTWPRNLGHYVMICVRPRNLISKTSFIIFWLQLSYLFHNLLIISIPMSWFFLSPNNSHTFLSCNPIFIIHCAYNTPKQTKFFLFGSSQEAIWTSKVRIGFNIQASLRKRFFSDSGWNEYLRYVNKYFESWTSMMTIKNRRPRIPREYQSLYRLWMDEILTNYGNIQLQT